ncbi:unnamed protein product, partial [Thlaspi arvense]
SRHESHESSFNDHPGDLDQGYDVECESSVNEEINHHVSDVENSLAHVSLHIGNDFIEGVALETTRCVLVVVATFIAGRNTISWKQIFLEYQKLKYGGKITVKRTWAKLPLRQKIKLVYSLFQAVFLPSPEELNKMLKELDNVDMVTLVIQEMSKEFPSLMDTLVHE